MSLQILHNLSILCHEVAAGNYNKLKHIFTNIEIIGLYTGDSKIVLALMLN